MVRPIIFSKKQSFVLGLLVSFCIVAGSFFIVRAQNRTIPISITPVEVPVNLTDRQIPTPPPDLTIPESTNSLKSLKDAKQVGFLILGYGGAGHQGGYLSDVILVAYVDVVAQKVALIHIPRDIWVDIKLGSTSIPTKINAALAMGTKSGNYPTKDLPKDSVLRGAYISKQAVKQITGLDIDYVIGIDFDGLKESIDAINGIDVHVSTVLNDPWYPIKGRELELCGHTPEDVTAMSATMSGFNLEKQFPCRYEQLLFNKGVNHMSGEVALKYVRSRHSSSDFSRGLRQIEVLESVRDKLLSLKVLDRIPDFYSKISASLKTDIKAESVIDFSPVLSGLQSYKTVQIGLSTSNVLESSTAKSGASILIPKSGVDNWQETHNYIKNQIYK